MDERVVPALLALQGVIGGIDTLVNHEWLARLPRRPEARTEIGLHSVREAIYATLFGGLAWLSWHGAAALLIAALLIGEIIVTARDEWVENQIRVLPQNERVLHIFLTLNLGVIIALLAPTLLEWWRSPTGFEPRDLGPLSWLLSALCAVAAFWSARDFLAWRRLRRA
jgi:hypothetical protein